ncbi:MAG: MBG domain-containing protein, partial [Clostridia bacterium]
RKNNAILLTNNTDYTAQVRNNTNAGTATLTLTGKGNYTGSIEKTFTIAKASLTITANAETITYGDSAPTYTAIYDGFVNGETLAVLDGSINCNYTIGNGISSTSNVYTITPNFTSTNYEITKKTATLTVNKKDLTINADNLSVVYNSDIPQYTLTFVGLYDGDKNAFNVPLSCVYKKDSNVGSYAITVGDISNNNYNITKTNGALTVTPKAVAVVWDKTAFSYDATVQTVNAHFVDVNGANVAVIVAITNALGNAEFKNAGEYTASATTTNANYTLTNTTTQCTMAKGTYTEAQINKVKPTNLTATYNPKASLSKIELPNGTIVPSEITLPSGFSWKASGTIPTPNVKQYAAFYNADTANYNNATVMLNVEVAKATATINANTVQSFNYNGAPHSAVATLTYGGTTVSTTDATLLYSNGNPFTVANTYKTTITIKSDLYQADDVTVFVKICAVLFNGTYYTIEDAINTANSGTIVVKFNTTFADTEIANVCYPNTSYYTIKTGVQLLVPYDDVATTDMEKFISGSGTLDYPFKTLTVPAGINLVCNGTINVNAQRSHHSTIYMGHTAGDYGVLDLKAGATLTLESGSTLNSNGYIIGGGSIVANSKATVYDVLAIKDFRGGQATSKIKGTLFPFNQ